MPPNRQPTEAISKNESDQHVDFLFCGNMTGWKILHTSELAANTLFLSDRISNSQSFAGSPKTNLLMLSFP